MFPRSSGMLPFSTLLFMYLKRYTKGKRKRKISVSQTNWVVLQKKYKVTESINESVYMIRTIEISFWEHPIQEEFGSQSNYCLDPYISHIKLAQHNGDQYDIEFNLKKDKGLLPIQSDKIDKG